ncbi:related to heterokaryon incompatibility protein [Phialocephala subalpina]|uniref:Related to heterokaryon incompatibility protein n=1 Tax=Phialocephala subalpina TaxID=576137 RepID=A0A1L7XNU3_9HELO|nr:related to heterokaryon incompatibility protein [Phialocephala subalpina]
MQVTSRQTPHQPFPYTPLNTSVSTIRLLRLQRTPLGSIIGWLEHFPLSDKHTRFNAVSYVWGPKTYLNKVNINDYPFPILDSLYPILETICEDESLSKCWWWIDSICINQGTDIEAETERNSQVAIMKQIYESAEMALGWLGPGSDDGENAIKFLHVLFRNRDRLGAERDEGKKVLGPELDDREGWKAVEKLLLRPWWIRVWTLQEYIVPSKFRFCCGKESIDRDELNIAIYAIYICQKIDMSLLSKQAWEPAWSRRRLLMWYRKHLSMNLLGLMSYIGDCKATDPRDRIYSVLGLVDDGTLVGRPRYEDDVGKVYTDLVIKFVGYYKTLDIICLADRFNGNAVSEHFRPNLPTWCPDWRAEIVPWVVPAMACQSAGKGTGNFRPSALPKQQTMRPIAYVAGIGDHTLEVKFSANRQILFCQGIFLDSVDGIGGLKAGRRRDKNSNEWEGVHDCVQSNSRFNLPLPPINTKAILVNDLKPDTASMILSDVMRCLVLDRKDRYLSHRLSGEGYCHRHFRDMCRIALQTPQNVDTQFLDWFQRNRQLYIQGYTLEEVCRKSEELESKCNGGLPDREAFLSRFDDTTQGMSRRLMTTNDGNTGMVPCRTGRGDQIWVLLGCSIPMVLRKRLDGTSFDVVGECYLNGFMHGEALNLLRHNRDTNVENIRLS